MAAIKAKRRNRLTQPKFPIYQALFNLNAAFQAIAFEIERLDDYEAVPLNKLRLYRMTAEELRSAMNHRLTEVLNRLEERDWYRYGMEVRMEVRKQQG